ncbi:MAG: phage antirepressor KilAC domain-containing protein [Massiliimalia sp.]|jgi:anti-repressor protein
MNQLIPIHYDNEHPAVSARELHEFLGVKTEFRHWFPRMTEYGFSDLSDYTPVIFDHPQNKQPVTDYALTIDMAKEICMLQRNEKGKQARQYFIEVEKEWNSPEKIMARALDIAHKTIDSLKLENAQQKQMLAEYSPKASYYDLVLQTTTALSASAIAKDYGKSAQWLNEKLHELRIQYKQGDVWLLYQKYAKMGYTCSKTHLYTDSNGIPQSKMHTYWTQKGRLFIYDKLKQLGILPMIERE